MKRYSLIMSALTLMLVLITATSALAVFPSYKPGLYPTLGDGSITIPIQQGWFDGDPAWYFCTDTNDVRFATTQRLTLAPRLSSALIGGANPLYIFLNGSNTPVFSTAPNVGEPGFPNYSGLWQVFYVTWYAGVYQRGVTSTDDLPDASEADIVPTSIVVDCPIVALGSLGQPTGNPQFGGIYRIPQVIALNAKSNPKTITLPTWNVFCRNNISRKIEIARLIIPDVEDPELAAILKANLAPGLADVPFEDTQNFWVVDWMQPADNGGVLVVPPGQLPIVEQCPNNFTWGCVPANPFSWRNTNFEYTPIYQFIVLDRFFDPVFFPGFTDKTVIKTPEFIDILINDGLVEVVFEGTKINAPQVATTTPPATTPDNQPRL